MMRSEEVMPDEELTQYLDTIVHKRSYSSYNGIIKRLYPKWVGWKYIDKIRKNKLPMCDTQLAGETPPHVKVLDTMSINFYLIKYLQDKFNSIPKT